MSASSTGLHFTERQHGVRPATLPMRDAIAEQIDRLRAAMVNGAPSGFAHRLTDAMGERKEWRSRQVGRDGEKLSVSLLLAEVNLHRAEGRAEQADALLAILTEGEPLRLPAASAVLIRLRDGQLFFDFDAPEVGR
jgi:hypothetical protein